MAKTKSKTKNKSSIVKQPKITPASSKSRKKPKYKSFRLHKRIKHMGPKLPSWWTLFKKALSLMKANKRPIFIFFIIYGILNIILIRGIAPLIDVESIKESYDELGLGNDGLSIGFTAFGSLLRAGTQAVDATAQIYQMLLIVVASLALIWLYRQQQAGSKVTIKMAFYRGMYPIIPFILIVLVIGLQLLPASIGNFIFSTVSSNGLVVGFLEQSAWVLFFVGMLLLSFYWISSSLVALFIVTLPEMTPMTALREAKELVAHRRFSVLIKVLALIILCALIVLVLVLPLIYFSPIVAEWIFFTLTVLAIPFIVAYLFCLYRELL